MEEQKLAQRLRQGDRFALNRTMDAYTPYLSSVVWRAMGHSATAQDVEEVVSDAFLALWRHREELVPEKGVKSWLAAVARNRAIDRLRSSPLPSLPLEAAEAEASGTSPDRELERRIFAQRLWAAVEQLGPPDDVLVARFYYEGDRLRDIAAALGLSVPAAKTRLCRARQKLKRILTEGGSENGADE